MGNEETQYFLQYKSEPFWLQSSIGSLANPLCHRQSQAAVFFFQEKGLRILISGLNWGA